MKNDTSLNFSELQCGKLILCKKGMINLMENDHGSDFKTKKILVEFPCPASSTNQIESCIKSRPLFSHLSLSWLEEMDHPYSYLQDASMIQGTLFDSYWQQRPNNHWLFTAEIQLLSAPLLRKTTSVKKPSNLDGHII